MFFEIGVVHSPNSTKSNLGNGLKQYCIEQFVDDVMLLSIIIF